MDDLVGQPAAPDALWPSTIQFGGATNAVPQRPPSHVIGALEALGGFKPLTYDDPVEAEYARRYREQKLLLEEEDRRRRMDAAIGQPWLGTNYLNQSYQQPAYRQGPF